MTNVVFDTTVFIDAYEGMPGAIALIDAVTKGDLVGWYCSVTVYELWVHPLARAEEFFYQSSLRLLRELPLTSGEARQVADWLRGSTRTQCLRLAADAMIAATAASLGATIYTRNPRDFARFYPNVESY